MIEIIDTLGQKNNGSFPLVDSNDIKGGYYQVESIEERNSVPLIRRKEGMLCHVKNDKIYQLNEGIDNANWREFKVGSDFDGDYESLINKPYIPVKTSDLENDNVYTMVEVDDIISNLPPCEPGEINNVYVGDDSPDNNDLEVWVDTSDVEEYTSNISDLVLDEFREIFYSLRADNEELRKKILSLEARVEYLEINGGGTLPPKPDDSEDVILSLEDGSLLMFEDGSILSFENEKSVEFENALMFEDGSLLMFEDGAVATYEGENTISFDSLMTFETNEVMTFKDNTIMIFE